MVEVEGGMVLFFEQDSLKKGEEFLQLLREKWPGRVSIGKDTEYGIEVKLQVQESTEPHYILFYLIPGQIVPAIPKASVLTFEPYVLESIYEEEIDLFHEIFLEACLKLKPVFGSVHATMYELHRPLIDQAEYYQNPYLFCVEPPLFFRDFDPKAFYDFLHNDGLVTKLAEIEEVMPREELTEIIRKHVERMVMSSDGGIGVLKNKVPQPCYPRYFIRQELRRRGFQLPEGLAEKYAAEFGIK